MTKSGLKLNVVCKWIKFNLVPKQQTNRAEQYAMFRNVRAMLYLALEQQRIIAADMVIAEVQKKSGWIMWNSWNTWGELTAGSVFFF